MAITKYDKEAKKQLEAERAAIQAWLDTNILKPGPVQVGGKDMVVDRDAAGLAAFEKEVNTRKTRMGELVALLADEAALTQKHPAPEAQKLDEAAGIGFEDPNKQRANSLAEILAGFDTSNVGPEGKQMPDVTKRAQANLLAGSVAQPQGRLAQFVQLLRTSGIGLGNQQSLEVLMQQLNDAKTSGKIDFDGLNAAIAANRTPLPDKATTRATMEATAASSGRTIEQVLADTLSGNRTTAAELAAGQRALSGLGAEARGVIKGRQLKAIAGLTGAGVAGYGTWYGMSGPSEIDKAKKMFRDTYYNAGGGPSGGLIKPKDENDYDTALGASYDDYVKNMIGEMNTARYGSYARLIRENKATIDALGRGDLSLAAEDEALNNFRRSLADFYARNGYKEDKPIAFPYRTKENKRSVFMTGKMGDKMARLMAKGEFEMAE